MASNPSAHVSLPRYKRPKTVSVKHQIWGGVFLALCVLGPIVGFSASAHQFANPLVWISAPLMLLPMPIVLATFLWIDRFEPEPRRNILYAFAWGAGIAVFFGGLLNSRLLAWFDAHEYARNVSAAIVGPGVEETAKVAGLLLAAYLLREKFNGIVDGIVYGGVIGLGFATVENLLYLAQSIDANGAGGVLLVFIMRGVLSPFMHSYWTAVAGVGIGYAFSRPMPASRRIIWIVLGYIGALLTHAAWNYFSGFGAGDDPTDAQQAAIGMVIYAGFYVLVAQPAFWGGVYFAKRQRAKEGELISRHLGTYGDHGWYTDADRAMLTDLKLRKQAVKWAKQTGGRPLKMAMVDYQNLSSELAYLRERMSQGRASDGDIREEADLLDRVHTLRSTYLADMPMLGEHVSA